MSCCYQPLKHSVCKRPIWRLAFICVSARGLAWSGLQFAVMLLKYFFSLSLPHLFWSLMLQDCFLVVSGVLREACYWWSVHVFMFVGNSVIAFPEFPLRNHNSTSTRLSVCDSIIIVFDMFPQYTAPTLFKWHTKPSFGSQF